MKSQKLFLFISQGADSPEMTDFIKMKSWCKCMVGSKYSTSRYIWFKFLYTESIYLNLSFSANQFIRLPQCQMLSPVSVCT